MTDSALIDAHILTIIQTAHIAEQSELQIFLKTKGYDVPQATLSRRLKKLNIAKVNGTYKLIDSKTPSLPLVLSMQLSNFGTIVLHTQPGNANSIASFIDQKYVNALTDIGLLGTIAGDDTVLLIIRDKRAQETVLGMLRQEFPYVGS